MSYSEGRKLGRKIRASLKADKIERARKVGEQASIHCQNGELGEAFRTLRGWYREAGDRAPKPCYQAMEDQTVEREKLYDYVKPPGEGIPSSVERPAQDDFAPSDEEIRRAVRKSNNGRAGGATQMRVEDLKCWLRGAEAEEKAESEGEEGHVGKGDTWRLLVRLIQHVWETGEIPQQLLRIIIVLIPKGNSGDYRGIGLLEVIWKVIERILDGRLSKIKLHDCLHGFREKRGCGTGIMEAKLAQQLAFIERTPLYVIFIDLHKAYDAMHRGRCLEILRAAGVGEKALRLIARFWKYSVMACLAGGRYGRRFKARRGVTQGGPLSPTIFNLMVDAVVREWLSRALSPEEAREAILQVRQLMAAFYADDAVVASRDPVKLQDSFNELTALFDRVGLKTNAKKTEVMVMTPGWIRAKLSPEDYEAPMRLDGENVRFGGRAPVGRRVQCPKCHKTLKAVSLRSHMETQHNKFEVFLPPAEDAAPL